MRRAVQISLLSNNCTCTCTNRRSNPGVSEPGEQAPNRNTAPASSSCPTTKPMCPIYIVLTTLLCPPVQTLLSAFCLPCHNHYHQCYHHHFHYHESEHKDGKLRLAGLLKQTGTGDKTIHFVGELLCGQRVTEAMCALV